MSKPEKDYYRWECSLSNGFLKVKNSQGKYGILNKQYELISPVFYDWIDDFEDGVIIMRVGGLYGLLSQDGSEIIPPTHNILYFQDGLAVIRNAEGYRGVVNRKGEVVVPHLFKTIELSDRGTIMVSTGGQLLKIDKDLNYYTAISEERIPCEKCNRLNDKLMTGLCCLLGK